MYECMYVVYICMHVNFIFILYIQHAHMHAKKYCNVNHELLKIIYTNTYI